MSSPLQSTFAFAEHDLQLAKATISPQKTEDTYEVNMEFFLFRLSFLAAPLWIFRLAAACGFVPVCEVHDLLAGHPNDKSMSTKDLVYSSHSPLPLHT